MKKLLTLLLVFSFAFSVSAVTQVTEHKADKFLIEKSIVKVDLVSINQETPVFTETNSRETEFLYQHRFRQEVYLIADKTKYLCGIHPNKDTLTSKLPDKNI